MDRTRIRDQKVSFWEQNCILLSGAHFLIVRTQIENNRSYGRIVYTLYWRSALHDELFSDILTQCFCFCQHLRSQKYEQYHDHLKRKVMKNRG